MDRSSLGALLAGMPAHLQNMDLSQPMPFKPEFRDCARHGSYQVSFADKGGSARYLANCPRCVNDFALQRLVDRAAIPPRFQDSELTNYRAECEGQKRALALSIDFAANFDEVTQRGACLTFVGRVGTGKTHLACAIAQQVMREGYSALFITVSELIRAVRATWGKDKVKTEEQVLKAFASVDLLILDEVGGQHGSDSEEQVLFEVINRRYSNMKPMILMSNLPLFSEDTEQRLLKDYLGERAFDRLREGGGKMVVFDWETYRKRV